MRKKMIKLVAFFIAVLFLMGVIAPIWSSLGFAAPSDAKVQEYEQKERSAWQEMQKLEQEINQLGEQLYQLETQIQESEQALLKTEEELAAATVLADEQRFKFRERFKVLAERGTGAYLETIFSAESFSDLIEKIVIVREIAEYDKTVLEAIEKVQAELAQKKQQIEDLRAEQEEKRAAMKMNEEALQRKSKETASYLESLAADKKAYIAYLEEKERQERLTKQKAGISGGVGTADVGRISGGTFTWPTNTSYITSHFSPNRVNPVTGVLRPHTGTDVGALQGAPVWAAQGGTVILAEANGGYGNCVILDHGNGVKTLYGHMSAILVKQGQTVSRGAQIGRVGSTGNSTGPHLHFEVLIDGVAVDPMQFF